MLELGCKRIPVNTWSPTEACHIQIFTITTGVNRKWVSFNKKKSQATITIVIGYYDWSACSWTRAQTEGLDLCKYKIIVCTKPTNSSPDKCTGFKVCVQVKLSPSPSVLSASEIWTLLHSRESTEHVAPHVWVLTHFMQPGQHKPC